MARKPGRGCAALGGYSRTRTVVLLVALAWVFGSTGSSAGMAPYAGAVNLVPSSPTTVGNCIPFGNNVSFGFSGFIYRSVPAFTMSPGTRFAFDLGNTNDVDVRRNIYFAVADHNPGPGAGNVRALAWTKVASDTQVPSGPPGNNTVGDYELTYTSESGFTFPGGGLIVGFSGSPPGTYADTGCEQVVVHTSSTDASGHFYARFWNHPDRDAGFLDRGTWSQNMVAGIVIFHDTTPPVVSATVSPAADEDGWIDPANGTPTVTWSGTDDQSGIALCDPPTELDEPGVYELTGSCSDNAGNVGAATVLVRVARRVDVDVMPSNGVDPFNTNRRGLASMLIMNTGGLDASTATFGVTGYEPSVRSCSASGPDVACRFDVAASGVAGSLTFRGYAGGVRVVGTGTVTVLGKP